MSRIRFVLSVCLLLASTACATAPLVQPLRDTPFPKPVRTLIWHGTGEASRFEDGAWKRVPAHDYELTVVQRRYGDRWESTKEMHRRHPGYDGSAGPRDQTFHFTLRFGEAGVDHQVPFVVESTLGHGTGSADAAFEHADLRLRAQVSRFAPFDTYALTQHYRYADGALDEVVRLLRAGEPSDQEWVRIEEHAALFAPTRLDMP